MQKGVLCIHSDAQREVHPILEEDYIKNTILLTISYQETPLFRQHIPFSHVQKRLLEV